MKLLKKLIIEAILISFLIPSLSFADGTAIRNITISNSYTHLTIHFQLANSFNEKMEEAINTGISTAFTFYINLYQHHPRWNDKLLMSRILVKTIKYDNLKKEYVITIDNNNENGESNSVFPTFKEAKKVMNQVEILSFYPMWKLERNNTYYLRIKAESKGVEPPAYIHYLLFFLKWMNFETDWIVEKFKY